MLIDGFGKRGEGGDELGDFSVFCVREGRQGALFGLDFGSFFSQELELREHCLHTCRIATGVQTDFRSGKQVDELFCHGNIGFLSSSGQRWQRCCFSTRIFS